MSHFTFESSLSEVTRLDGPIQDAPMLRWQRKALETGMRKMSLDGDVKPVATSLLKSNSTQKSPMRSPCIDRLKAGTKSPYGQQKIANRTPGNQGTSVSEKLCPSAALKNKPARTPNKTPVGDRFIPSRSAMDMEAGHFRLLSSSSENDGVVPPSVETEYQRQVSEALGANFNTKILCFREKAPAPKEGTRGNVHLVYSGSVKEKSAACSRMIPQQCDRILDAPQLLDDYYLNLLSWSNVGDQIALALGSSVFLWGAKTGVITELSDLTTDENYVSSVSWLSDANIIAVGNSLGTVQIWDVSQERLVRTMPGHASRVGALSWNSYLLSSGSRTGSIHHHDVRVASHHVATLAGHTQEVCGLQWSPDGRHLASGANDNLLLVWDRSSLGPSVAPLLTFNQHMAAVKAIAWCPWQPSLLASGGGTADRQIRLWNVSTSACLQTTETRSQVCAILWSSYYRELVSGHGFSQNQLTLWKYPSMLRVADLMGHTSRVLSLAMSPDGTTVCSAAADETLRFWKCFDHDKHDGKASTKVAVKDKDTNRNFGSLSLVR